MRAFIVLPADFDVDVNIIQVRYNNGYKSVQYNAPLESHPGDFTLLEAIGVASQWDAGAQILSVDVIQPSEDQLVWRPAGASQPVFLTSEQSEKVFEAFFSWLQLRFFDSPAVFADEPAQPILYRCYLAATTLSTGAAQKGSTSEEDQALREAEEATQNEALEQIFNDLVITLPPTE